MESSLEEQCSALGGLFQQIIAEIKNGAPLWEDLILKALKLHSCLRTAIAAIAGYLDAFQKIADAATNARGATKEIGSALTRICLRHRAVESRMKVLTSTIMDRLITPLQEKLEEWKKTVVNLDKEHAKEYKRVRSDLKKRSSDTLRLQKKARKGKCGELDKMVENSLADVSECRSMLEQTESRAVRAALIEHRSRFCHLVDCFQPVVDEEVGLLGEMGHIQEAAEALAASAAEPTTLPAVCEELIDTWMSAERQDRSLGVRTPPSSPSSLGSRKSSMASISSLSSSSSSAKWHASVSQLSELCVGEVSEPVTPQQIVVSPNQSSNALHQLSSTTWPNVQEKLQFERAANAILIDRPHTISSAYERGHHRTPLSVMTFHAAQSQPSSPGGDPQHRQPPAPPPRPPIPQRGGSSLSTLAAPPLSPRPVIVKPRTTDTTEPQGIYINMSELAWMAASKAQEMTANLPPPPPELTDCSNVEGSSESGYYSQALPAEANGGTRRFNSNGAKPAPPIRRTASISCHQREQQTVPMPPVFNEPPPNEMTGSREHLPPPPAFLLENGSDGDAKEPTRVAETVRALTALQHTPASPNAPRKVVCNRSISLERRDSVITTLTSRLSHPLSPRHLRRHSEGVGRAGQKLLESLNARLASQQSARLCADPVVLRQSLMEEIKQGAHLRKTRGVNDRSAPHIF